MTQAVLTDIETTTAELAVRSFEAFCEDIGSMFGAEIECSHQNTTRGLVTDLKKDFGKLAGIASVKAEGAVNGIFDVVFDKKGLFTLAGIVVMLPEERVAQLCKTGEASDAQELADAVRETGNLLVGSWDRTFREGMQGHGHFVRKEVFIGDPWSDIPKSFELEASTQGLLVICTITAQPYAPFKVAAIIPTSSKAAVTAAPTESVHKNAQPEPAQTQTSNDDKPAAQTPDIIQKPEQLAASEPTPVETAPNRKIVEQAKTAPTDITVSDIMLKDLVWVDEETPVGRVFQVMESGQTSYALVGKDGCPKGILSRYDIAGAISPYLNPPLSKWRRPQDDATLDIKVKWVMSKAVRVINADAPVNIAAAKMLQHRVGCLPATDKEGKVVGLVTRQELMTLLLTEN